MAHRRQVDEIMPSNVVVNLVGEKFGCWEVISLEGRPSSNLHHCRWKCKCVCGQTKIRTGSNLKKSKDVHGCHCGFSHRSRPYEALYNTLVKLAKQRDVRVDLSYEEYLTFTSQEECHYCGAYLFWLPFNKMNGHKLDRKDNCLGYSLENCVVCCPRCNRAKSNHFTYEEWVQIGALIKSWNQTIRRI
jgi:5-methylcytosine-specific restriction endonuclease McrA